MGTLPTLWKHHDKPKITDFKINSMDDSDVQGPQTFEATSTTGDGIWLGLRKYEYVSFPRPIGHFPSSHSLWHGRLTYPHCHYLSNATLDEIQFREQCTKWIKTNVEYIQGLTGEQLALWKLHHKLDLQKHIDDKVFLAQIADQKVKTTTWKEMYKLDHSKCDWIQQMERQLQERQDAAEA